MTITIRLLTDVYTSIVTNEFTAGRYIGPFTHAQLEADLGPFQTSPLSLVPKTLKPGKFHTVHNFSHPHNPLPTVTSINSQINSDEFPCTWGTFSTVFLLVARLPPGSQALVRDVAEAYRMIPADPFQWPGLIIHLQEDDQFAVNICNNFGLASAGGIYGMVANAGVDLFQSNGVGPFAKWVDNHIFFRILQAHCSEYNKHQSMWQQEILLCGGRRQCSSRLWYGGKNLPGRSSEEFDKDCSMVLADLAEMSPCNEEDHGFTYADANIDRISSLLGIQWELSKSVPFGTEVLYLSFHWDLRVCMVHLLEEKRVKYLTVITEWEKDHTHNLLETQQLYRKLLHTMLVLPAGRAYLTNLEAMLALFHNSAFIPHSPPRDTEVDIQWWRQQLSCANLSRPIREPCKPTEYHAYSDTSSGSPSQLGPNGTRGDLSTDGNPRGGTYNGLKPLASSSLSWPYVTSPREGSTSWYMGTTVASSKDGGSGRAQINPPTKSSVVFSNCQRIAIEQYTRNMSLASRTLPMTLPGVATHPSTSYSVASPYPMKSTLLSSTSDPTELVKGAMHKWLQQAQGKEEDGGGVDGEE